MPVRRQQHTCPWHPAPACDTSRAAPHTHILASFDEPLSFTPHDLFNGFIRRSQGNNNERKPEVTWQSQVHLWFFYFFQKNLVFGVSFTPPFSPFITRGFDAVSQSATFCLSFPLGKCTLKNEYDLKTSPCSSHCSEVLRAEDKPRAKTTWEIKGTPVRLGLKPRDGWPTRMGRG